MTKQANTTASIAMLRPPVVTVLGHVDHGKTTLLDTIRKTNITSREHGGITQHIGVYQISIPLKEKKHRITFIDTPGHEAFIKMRARGATVADIAILVVAGNDGVMPQTIESINHIKKANIPTIVVINKIDLPDVNLVKVKKQLSRAGLNLEEYGGDIPVIPLSAKSGKGVDKLFEMIMLLSELYLSKKEDTGVLYAVVIESSLSKQKGPVATVIVRNGKIERGKEIICDTQIFRVKALTDWQGKQLETIGVGDGAEVLGWKMIPTVGSIVIGPEKVAITAPSLKELRIPDKPQEASVVQAAEQTEEKIKIILKADTAGSLEAINSSLADMVQIISSGIGNISESDVLLAKTTKSIIIGFHSNPSEQVIRLAQSEKVIIKTYNVVYKLFEEISDVIEALKKNDLVTVLGEAKIIAQFHFNDEIVAGVKVISGRIARGDSVKVIRNGEEVSRSKIKSLRHLKEDITRSEQGQEAGVILAPRVDFLTGDSIISIG